MIKYVAVLIILILACAQSEGTSPVGVPISIGSEIYYGRKVNIEGTVCVVVVNRYKLSSNTNPSISCDWK